MASVYSSIKGDNPLYKWLDEATALIRSAWGPYGDRLAEVQGPFGIHSVLYGEDDDGEFATVGFTLPDYIYGEIEDGTYGQLQGFRIYRDVE